MKKITVKITVPKKGEMWKVAFNGGSMIRPDASSAFGHIERRLSKATKSTKISLIVDYGALHPNDSSEWINDGVYSSKNDALYALACFLENFLLLSYQREKYKKYHISI